MPETCPSVKSKDVKRYTGPAESLKGNIQSLNKTQ